LIFFCDHQCDDLIIGNCKADIGIKDGKIVCLKPATDTMDSVTANMIIGALQCMVARVLAGGIDTHIHCPQQIDHALLLALLP
jgi:urease alpha subunit